MYKAYIAVRDKWAILDCYRSPGPIQLYGPSSDSVTYLVKPPTIDEFVRETEEHEKFENSRSSASLFHRHTDNLSELAKELIKYNPPIPQTLSDNSYGVIATKKYKPYS